MSVFIAITNYKSFLEELSNVKKKIALESEKQLSEKGLDKRYLTHEETKEKALMINTIETQYGLNELLKLKRDEEDSLIMAAHEYLKGLPGYSEAAGWIFEEAIKEESERSLIRSKAISLALRTVDIRKSD